MFPFHLNLGFNTFFFYEGLYFLIAIVTGVVWSRVRVKREGIDVDQFDSFILWVLLGAVIGGRLSNYIFWSTETFLKDPISIFYVWQGGISITGGIGGGILGAWIYSKTHNFPFWKTFATVSAPLFLAQGVGRIGCFLNGDAHGTACSLPWGIQFPKYGTELFSFTKNTEVSSYAWRWSVENGLIDRASTLSAPIHPTQIYEAIGDFIMVFVILNLFAKVKEGKLPEKFIFFTHIAAYFLMRFLLEFIRADRSGMMPMGVMSWMQLVCIILAVFSFIKMFLMSRKSSQLS